jgi:formylglycine-generating enzyme required for sulfatase activity
MRRSIAFAAAVAAFAWTASAAAQQTTLFRDCPECPEMLIVEKGSYAMGAPAADKETFGDEGPQRRVTFAKRFAIGMFEVTFDEWDACAAAKGCKHRPGDAGWGRGRRPVINVSWNDTQAYLAWLRRKSGKAYRLPSEAEWEYAARAGTTTRFFWGDEVGSNRANCAECSSATAGKQTAPVGSFAANPWRLHDVHGNAWEWTQDCWSGDLRNTPADGRPALGGDCRKRVLRGGSYLSPWRSIRITRRDHNTTTIRADEYGFRVARPM